MTDLHPILSLPSELVEKWANMLAFNSDEKTFTEIAQWGAEQQLKVDAEEIDQAYTAGADSELEACCDEVHTRHGQNSADWLLSKRRPKPPSLKEQALELLPKIKGEDVLHLCPLQVAKSAAYWRPSMTNQHPITPPPELVQQWDGHGKSRSNAAQILATQSARWGADQELEACCEWLSKYRTRLLAADLRYVRRPAPLTLKEQALADLESMSIEPCLINGIDVNASVRAKYNNIRRALEQLND